MTRTLWYTRNMSPSRARPTSDRLAGTATRTPSALTREPGDQARFDTRALALLTIVRDSIGSILSALPEGWGSVTQVAKALGLERTLAWKLTRIASAADPFAVVQHLPGDRAMQRAWNALERSSAQGALANEGKAALTEFRSLDVHVADRALLSLLVGGQATQGREDMDLAQRRAAFRAASYLLGANAQILYDATFLGHNAEDPSYFDLATIRGFRGLSRMRDGIAWPIARRVMTAEMDGQVEHVGEPMAPDDVDQGVPVMRRFSSKNLPPLKRIDAPEGFARFAVEPRVLGKDGALDVFVGERYRRVTSSVVSAQEPNHAIAVLLRTPCRVAVIEQFVPRGLFASVPMTMMALSTVFGEPTQAEIQMGRGLRVPLFETVESLGAADRALPVRGLTHHREMAELGAAGLGFALADMDLYRITLEFPPEPTLVVMSAPFPKA